MRSLHKKGVPLHIAITFMLAVPIVNPVVILSTYSAFTGNIEFVILRTLLGMIGAITVGFLISLLSNNKSPLKEIHLSNHSSCGCGQDHSHNDNSCGCEHDHKHSHENSCGCSSDHDIKQDFSQSIESVLRHTSSKLYFVGRFLIAGAFISALMQTFMPRNILLSMGSNNILSILVLMTLAFILSICSEADAFIARTFIGQFTNGSIVGFLIFGPMIDIKNTIMLAGTFEKSFVIKLISLITLVSFVLSLLVNFIGI
jgi:uncharacterized membrane protein YraQ (UPF0718 family)